MKIFLVDRLTFTKSCVIINAIVGKREINSNI